MDRIKNGKERRCKISETGTDTAVLSKIRQRKKTLLNLPQEELQSMMILFWGTGLCFLAAVFTGEAKEITFLARPSYGQGSMETDLEVQVEGEGEAQKIPILLQERQYSDQQIDEFFSRRSKIWKARFSGENISMQEVRSSLEFPSSVLDGKVKADWFTDDLGLIDEKETWSGSRQRVVRRYRLQ